MPLGPLETCCAFFQHGFVERVAQDATSSVQESLDAPARLAPPLHFLSRIHRAADEPISLDDVAREACLSLRHNYVDRDFALFFDHKRLALSFVLHGVFRAYFVRF